MAFWIEEDVESIDNTTALYQLFFIVDMLANFVTEHHYPGSIVSERGVLRLIQLYLRGRFLSDLLALLPFSSMLSTWIAEPYIRLFGLIKLIRIRTAFELMDPKANMKQIKEYFQSRMQKLIESNHELSICQTVDNNQISKLISISYAIRTTQLLILILSLSYFFGILWYIFGDIIQS